MPPKSKFTKEEIVSAALALVREKGAEALTARELGKQLGSSARPIFTVFQGMEEVHAEVRKAAHKKFEQFVHGDMTEERNFKQIGENMLQFALEEPRLYQMVFMYESCEKRTFEKMMREWAPGMKLCVEQLRKEFGLEYKEAEVFFETVWIHTFGIGALYATGMCSFSREKLNEMIMRNFQGQLLLARSGKILEPEKFTQKTE